MQLRIQELIKDDILDHICVSFSRSNDGLETSFNAFKIPESNFLVFEATVRYPSYIFMQ